jgi:hypothetical protein
MPAEAALAKQQIPDLSLRGLVAAIGRYLLKGQPRSSTASAFA